MGQELHFGGPKNLGPHLLRAMDLLDNNDPSVRGSALYANSEFVKEVQFVRRVRRSGIADSQLRSCVEVVLNETGGLIESFEDRCRLVRRIGETGAQSAGKAIWGFKIMRQIQQWRHYADNFNSPRIVHIVRDGRDVAASQVFEHNWGYKSITAAAHGWAKLLRKASGGGDPGPTTVRYEDIVERPSETLRQLSEQLGLPFDAAILTHESFHHALFDDGHVHPSRQAVQKPLNAAAIGKYRGILSNEEIDLFEHIAGDELRRFHYPVGQHRSVHHIEVT